MENRRDRGKQQNISRAASLPLTGGAERASNPRLSHLARLADRFEAACRRCLSRPDIDAVHRVRTGSRRIQAMIETMEREAGGNASSFARRAAPWLRRLKKIRRAAGPVRDLDVHRKLLKKWMESRTPKKFLQEGGSLHARGQEEQEERSLSRQATILDQRLKGRRQDLAEALKKQIGKQLDKIQKERQIVFSRDPLGPLPDPSSGPLSGPKTRVTPSPSAAMLALANFVHLSDATPILEANNLHEFRKSTKKARYVAESGGKDTRAKTVAHALKQMQDAIGDWHDWQCLAQDVKSLLGSDGVALKACFEPEVERHFNDAVRVTTAMRGRLLGEWMAAAGSAPKRAREDGLGDRQIRKMPQGSASLEPMERDTTGVA